MNHKTSLQEFLDQSFARFRTLPQAQVESACDRVLDRLQRETDRAQAAPANSLVVRSRWGMLSVAAAVAAAILVVVFLQFPRGTLARAVVESPDGSLSRLSSATIQVVRAGERIEAGEVLRANSSGARIALSDASRVELRAGSEFSLEREKDGVRMQLFKGGVIINAAKQLAGHLYVQTKDVTVSVVGTVFLVNAEEEGSRVAVIEGEVSVQHGGTEKKLLPGEQLSTSPSMGRLPVPEEISWSERAPEHIALLQRATAPAAPARLKFAVASIHLIAANTTIPGTAGGLRGSGLGLACRGTDGIQRVLLTFTNAGQASVTAPQGRCVGRGVFLSTLIEFAYGVQSRHVSGGPDWARTNPFITFDEAVRGADVLGASAYTGSDGFRWLTEPSFQIEATADDPSTATLEQLKQMLQTMLTERFNLKFHRASSFVSGYALIVGSKGPKLKPVSDSYEESLVPHKGKSTVEKLAQTLSRMLEAPVVDKTGLTGAFEYEFRRAAPVGGVMPGPIGGGPLSDADRAELLSLRLEDQLGLRLAPEKSIPAETFVIESVEPPTPN